MRTRARAAAVLLAPILGAVLAGCGRIGDAQQVIDRAHLVNDLASRLDHASELTYTAEYELPGGGHATIAQAQKPLRTAYTYPAGKFATTPDSTADCRVAGGRQTCTLTAPPSPPTNATVDLLAALRERGLVPPTLVVGLLTAASLSSNAVINQHDTTIAGEHATCVDAAGVENAETSTFTACITAAGVLGSFRGTIDGTTDEVSLISYRATVAENAFDLPADATVVDQRPPGHTP